MLKQFCLGLALSLGLLQLPASAQTLRKQPLSAQDHIRLEQQADQTPAGLKHLIAGKKRLRSYPDNTVKYAVYVIGAILFVVALGALANNS